MADAIANKASTNADDVRKFQALVGSLLYAAMNTRPDIAYAVGMLCRCMSKPKEDVYREAVRALCYVCWCVGVLMC